MKEIINKTKETFKNDLINKEIIISKNKIINVLFLESLSSGDKVNDYVLKNLTNKTRIKDISSNIAGPNTKKITSKEIDYYLESGFTIVIYKNEILAVETRAEIIRAVGTPESESSITGPKDAFNENYQVNIGLIKRRLKTSSLRIDNLTLGRRTKTQIGLLYCEDIVEDKTLNDLKSKLGQIDIDGIIDSENLALLLSKGDKANFPTIKKTERPDLTANALLEGKIAIVVDNSCFVLILPAFFIDFINPQSDNYTKSGNINFVKILRLLCFFISMMAPAIYIALINYNQESIPTSLLINFTQQRDGVPFPALVEALITILTCEILRESDLRFPNAYGSAISILGALVLGEAAVSAGIVSPIMIIVIATTFISSLIFTEYDIITALRHYRFVFLFAAALYGIIGILLVLLYFLIRINDVYSFGKPYFFPISPFDKTYFKKSVVRGKTKNDTERSEMLTNKDKTKMKSEA